MRPVLSLQLYDFRANKHVEPQPGRYVLNVLGYAVLGLLMYLIAALLMSW